MRLKSYSVAFGTSLAVQWLRLHACTARGTGLIPGRGAKILHAVQCSPKKKKKIIQELFRKVEKVGR